MKPTIPGIQSNWTPNAYPLPQQAAAAPPSFNPASVYSFGNGQFQAPQGRAPVLPGAPGYIGPSMAQAYQMAGPRVGFQAPPPPPTMPQPGTFPAPNQGGFRGGGIFGNMIRQLQQRGAFNQQAAQPAATGTRLPTKSGWRVR